jgi:hypothetical protein
MTVRMTSRVHRRLVQRLVHRRGALTLCCGLWLAVAITACTDTPPVSRTDSLVSVPAGGDTGSGEARPTSSGWDAGAGPYLVLPTVDGGFATGSFLLPEATELTVSDTTGVTAMVADGALDLFTRSGQVFAGHVVVEPPSVQPEGCTAWPVARVRIDTGAILPWTAAFRRGQVRPIPLDSIEGLASRDSAVFAAALARLASGLPDDTNATFRGRPFVVLRAWRSSGSDSSLAVATLVRRINQEDNPQEERLVMIVDMPTRDARQWTVGWHERAAGAEDELVVAEPLLAFRNAASDQLRVLFGRDDGVALGAAVLARSDGRWRVLWESAVAGCE